MSFLNGIRTKLYTPFRSSPQLQEKFEQGLRNSYYGLVTIFGSVGLFQGAMNGFTRLDEMSSRNYHNYGKSVTQDLMDASTKTAVFLGNTTGGALIGLGIGLTSPISLPILVMYNNTNVDQSSDNFAVIRRKFQKMNQILHMSKDQLKKLD